MSLPPTGIIGTGALGRALHRMGEPVAVASSDVARASAAAASVGPTAIAVGLTDVPARASHLIFATSDSRIEAAATALADAGMDSGVALHTSGALGPSVLAPLAKAGVSCGVFHPLQTVAASAPPRDDLFRGITIGIGGVPRALAWARELAALLGARTVVVEAGQFAAYHAGAVLASNAVVGLIDAAVRLLGSAGVGRDVALRALEPLVRTAVDNALTLGPRDALSGPVARGDVVTVTRHLQATGELADVDAVYRAASRYLVELASERHLTEQAAQALRAILDTHR